MKMWRVRSLAFCVGVFFASVPLLSQGQNEPKPAEVINALDAFDPADVEAMLLQSYTMGWQNESKRLSQMFDMQEEVISKLNDDMTPLLKKLAAVEAKQKEVSTTGDLLLGNTKLLKAILPALEGKLTPQQLKRYQADMKIRQDFGEELSMLSVLIVVQDTVAADADQLKKLEATLKDRVDSRWLSTMQGFGLPTLDDETSKVIAKQLTKKQNAAWKLASQPQAGMLFLGEAEEQSEEQQRTLFRDGLEAAVEARIESLERYLSLDASQVKKLNVLARGIQDEVCQKHTEATKQLRNMQFGENQMPDARVMEYASSPPGALFVHHERWNVFLGKILNDDQRKKMEAMRSNRAAQGKLQMAGMISVGMGYQFGLEGDKTIEFAKLLQSYMPESRPGLRFSTEFIEAIVAIPQDKVQEIIGEQHMAMWNEQMDQAKQMLNQRDPAIEVPDPQ